MYWKIKIFLEKMLYLQEMPSNWTIAFGAGFALVASFDVYWFLRLAYTRLVSLFRKPMAITDVSNSILNLKLLQNKTENFSV